MVFDPIKARQALGVIPGDVPQASLPRVSTGWSRGKALEALAPSAAPVARQVASGPSPDEEASNLTLAADNGLQVETVRQRPDDVKVKDLQRRFESTSPALRSMLRDVDFARLARDDLDNLGWWERHAQLFRQGQATAIAQGQEYGRDRTAAAETRLLGRALRTLQDTVDQTLLSNEDGTPNMVGRLANLARGMAEDATGVPRQQIGGPEVTQEQRRDAILARELNPMGQGAKEVLEALQEGGVAPKSLGDIDSFGSAIAFMTENLASSIPAMMATVAGGGLSPIVNASILSAEANAELAERTDLSVEDRTAIAGGAGALMSMLDLFGLSKILGPITPGKLATDAIAGTLADRMMKSGVSMAASRTIQAAIAEGSTELLQEGIVMTVTSMAGGEYTADEVRERLATAFAAGGAVGGGLRGGVETGGATGNLLRDAARWANSGRTSQQLTTTDAIAEASKLRERAPETFQKAINALGLEDSSVQIPAAEVQTFYQSELSDETLAQLGVERTDFEAMLATGGDISVPMANYATHFAGTDTAAMFAEHGVFDDTEMSVAEARAYEEGVGQEVVTALEADMAANREQVTDIRESMRQQLTAAGRTTRVADTEALVFSSLWETLARKKGAAADALASRFGLEVRGMSDILPGGAADRVAAGIDPAASEPSPPTPETVFQQPAAKDMEIEVEMDDGATETLPAGQVYEAYQARQNDAQSLLNCLINA